MAVDVVQMEGHRKHVWAKMKMTAAARTELGAPGGDLKDVTEAVARNKREAAAQRRRAMKKAGECGWHPPTQRSHP